MRKHQHKQILDIIATLKEANSEIRRLFQQGQLSAVLRLLGDCQEGAVQIGEFIEIIQGEGTKTVALLEEYHESLYRAGEEIETADASFMKSLQKQLFLIENSVRSELAPDRIEAAFFPYKVSMWDSLESIWLAAKEDPGCDAYVVPIPYFDRLPDGTFGQMHYEGNMYPDDVPVVDWRAYRLEERRPDVIFIHNPYDDRNAVTSVHPDYYSDRLKAFTDLVCYVPYFVTPGDVEEHFVLCPGVLNADRVFLQSEKIRETYIRVFKEFEKKNRCVGQFGKAEKKFVASGSPKFDRVLNTKREDYDLPEEWKTLIDNKKVIFYNTSVGALLEGDEQYLKKLRSVLDIFHRRIDMVLWWRPHPLSEATYRSMRPHLLAEYEQIVAEYRREGWGIYDDTPDFHRAICMSDAYLGDWSSLVALFQVTGKLILLQEIDESEHNDVSNEKSAVQQVADNMMIRGMCEDGDYLWFIPPTFNGLFKMHKDTWLTEYMGGFPCENPYQWSPYGDIVKVGSKLFFAPFSANAIGVYDIIESEFSSIPINLDLVEKDDSYSGKNSYYAAVFEQKIFFMPRSFPAFIVLDTESNEVRYINDWKEKLKKLPSFNSEAPISYKGSVVDHSRVFLPCFNANALLELDMREERVNVIELGTFKHCYCANCYDGKHLWLVAHTSFESKDGFNGNYPNGFNIAKYDVKSGTLTELDISLEGFELNGKYPDFDCAVYLNGYVYISPVANDLFLKIDTATDEISKVDELKPEERQAAEREKFFFNFIGLGIHNNRIYVTSGKSRDLISYSPLEKELRKSKMQLTSRSAKKLREYLGSFSISSGRNFDQTGCWLVESQIDLEDFLAILTDESYSEKIAEYQSASKKWFASNNSSLDDNCGVRTYNYCKQIVGGRDA